MLSISFICIIFAEKYNNMKLRYARLVALLGLSVIMLIQLLWLYNSFNFVKNEFTIQATSMLEQAMIEETFTRMQSVPLGTRIEGRAVEDKNSNIPEFVYLQESLEKLNKPISLDTLNRIYRHLLSSKKYPQDCAISILKGKDVVQKIGTTSSSLFNMQTHAVPLRKDYSIVVQAELINPDILFFSKMGLLLVATTILVILVVGCIIYQIKSILRLKKIFQIREDFSYALIHDMKTPLTSILSVLKFLQSGSLDDKPEMKEKYFQIAESEVNHLLALTNKVLVISKLESGTLVMDKKEILLAPMMKELVENFTAKTSKPVHFTLDLQVEETYADGEYLKEVISNLIDNAIKYSKESVDIKISSERDKEYTVIKVRDNGLGISIEDQRVIFNKFERASASRRSRKGGATGFGLGLNLVQKVVDAHEGRIIVNSIEGEFAEFIIYLPQIMQSL